MNTRCLLADDHPALVAAVGDFLEENGFTVIGPAADGDAALATAVSEQPDIAVVDYRMPGLNGRELLTRLADDAPDVRVLIYTAEAGDALVQEALDRGAAGIVLKEAPLADLVRALEAVQGGGTYVDPALATVALGAMRPSSPKLTERERDVLSHLSRGESHEEIGRALGISIETVRTHLRKACDKLGAATRTQAVASALRMGLIE
jgi:two-component system nitrate/nitrite response regulator NarL